MSKILPQARLKSIAGMGADKFDVWYTKNVGKGVVDLNGWSINLSDPTLVAIADARDTGCSRCSRKPRFWHLRTDTFDPRKIAWFDAHSNKSAKSVGFNVMKDGNVICNCCWNFDPQVSDPEGFIADWEIPPPPPPKPKAETTKPAAAKPTPPNQLRPSPLQSRPTRPPA